MAEDDYSQIWSLCVASKFTRNESLHTSFDGSVNVWLLFSQGGGTDKGHNGVNACLIRFRICRPLPVKACFKAEGSEGSACTALALLRLGNAALTFEASREMSVNSKPALASCLTTGLPMSPVAPITAIFWNADMVYAN